MNSKKVDVVILAGAEAGEIHPENPSLSRAMVHVAGKPMLQWVVDAFHSAPSIGRIVVVGDVDIENIDTVVEPGGSFIENIRKGLEEVGRSEHVVLATCDIPLLTPEAVEDFIQKAGKIGADFAYPIVPKVECEQRYPGIKRTYLRTADGVFTGGNIVLVNPQFVLDNWRVINEAYAARKQVLKLARIIGLGVLLRAAFAIIFPRLLRISVLENAAARIVGGKIAAVVSTYPEIAEDIDKYSDLTAIEEFLARKAEKQTN